MGGPELRVLHHPSLESLIAMVVAKPSSIDQASAAPKCLSLLKSIQKKKVELDATGQPRTNSLLKFLRCQVKSTKGCIGEEKTYMNCHMAVMGTGSFKGKSNCGEDMEGLFSCVVDSLKA